METFDISGINRPKNHPLIKTFSAILSGVMLSASFPPGNLSYIAWFALVPLLFCTRDEKFSRALTYGFVAGLAHYLTLIYWIVDVLGHYGNLSPAASIAPYLLLCLYLTLFPAFFAAFSSGTSRSVKGLVVLSSFWVALEYVRTVLLTGFPWCLLGYTQYRHIPIIQLADIFGVYGVSFLIVMVNGLFFHILTARWNTKKHDLKGEILLACFLIVSALAYGYMHILGQNASSGAPKTSLRALIVQGNIDQSLKWHKAYQKKTLETYERMTRAGTTYKPDVIVWPETSMPFFFQDGRILSRRIVSIARESEACLIFGSPAYKKTPRGTHYYNRAYIVPPRRGEPTYYDKVHLVPFGEYVPLKEILSFVGRLVPAAGDFKAGDGIRPLTCNGVNYGLLICFEAIFPDIARKHTKRGADLLVNITNDAWFGKSSAPHHHLSMAAFRAVENRRPILRAANTGFSAFINAEGEILTVSPLFEEWVLKGETVIESDKISFYTRYGDLFAYLSIVISIVAILSRFLSRRKSFH